MTAELADSDDGAVSLFITRTDYTMWIKLLKVKPIFLILRCHLSRFDKMTVVNLEFPSTLSKSDPQKQPVIIIGQLKNLMKAKYSSVKAKLEPHVTEQVFGGTGPSCNSRYVGELEPHVTEQSRYVGELEPHVTEQSRYVGELEPHVTEQVCGGTGPSCNSRYVGELEPHVTEQSRYVGELEPHVTEQVCGGTGPSCNSRYVGERSQLMEHSADIGRFLSSCVTFGVPHSTIMWWIVSSLCRSVVSPSAPRGETTLRHRLLTTYTWITPQTSYPPLLHHLLLETSIIFLACVNIKVYSSAIIVAHWDSSLCRRCTPSAIIVAHQLVSLSQVYSAALASLHPSPTDSCSLYLNLATVAALPVKCSRHNTPSRAHFITKLVKSATVGVDESVVIVCRREDVFASACAVARAYPLYSRKTTNNLSASTKTATVQVHFVLLASSDDAGSMAVSNGTAEGELVLGEADVELLKNAAMAVRLAARIVDTPCNEMNVDTFVQEVLTVGQALGVKSTVIRGEELNERGFGGIYGVGKAALVPPALVVLSYLPQGATETIAWVGKGIVYDTGGLSIKGKVTTR
uniref:Cytosol aminopeptidase domain-containing protein n=1 Tax=Timema poppense TaxID=170557 RepID=A0A7R9DLH4_TIMPO|nr:unnamed protein product [Timema poppensis]